MWHCHPIKRTRTVLCVMFCLTEMFESVAQTSIIAPFSSAALAVITCQRKNEPHQLWSFFGLWTYLNNKHINCNVLGFHMKHSTENRQYTDNRYMGWKKMDLKSCCWCKLFDRINLEICTKHTVLSECPITCINEQKALPELNSRPHGPPLKEKYLNFISILNSRTQHSK